MIDRMVNGVPPRLAAALTTALGAGALALAFAAQYLGGLAPCVLCIYQRYPYGVVAGLGILALLLGGSRGTVRALVALAGIALLVNAGIAAFHVGVEQHWWAGTAECGATLGAGLTAEELKAQLMAAPVVRCDEIPWSLFGISMAGYNFLLALVSGLAALAWAARSRSTA